MYHLNLHMQKIAPNDLFPPLETIDCAYVNVFKY